MIGHPFLLGAMVLDVSALTAIAVSAMSAMRIAAAWQPASAASGQLRLESQAEAASIAGRTGMFLYTAGTAALLTAVTVVMPALVPGAMCGTGVLQAAGPAGVHAVNYRLAALLAYYLWASVDSLNRRHPMAPLTQSVSNLMLLVLPLAALAAASTWSTLAGMDTHRPVDCCMVVYDQFASLAETQHTAGLSNSWWTGAYGVFSVLMVATAAAVRRRPGPAGMAVMAAGALAWTSTAAITLTRTLSPYLYGVLHHHCPWCLFTPSGAGLGFPLAIAAAVVLLESAAAPVVWWMASHEPALAAEARARAARAGARVALAVMVFVGVSAAPALSWYWKWGVWITGGR